MNPIPNNTYILYFYTEISPKEGNSRVQKKYQLTVKKEVTVLKVK